MVKNKFIYTKIQSLLALLLLACIAFACGNSTNVCAQQESRFNPNDYAYTLSRLTATDALGRELTDVSGYDENKHVGLFYFLWHGQHRASTVRNVTELLRTNYDDLFDPSYDNLVVPYNSWLHYNEPLYGYYNSTDKWVMRKHIEMFIVAGVDFLMLDFTNATIYWTPLNALMELLIEYKEAGWDVPQISFYINLDANRLTRELYEKVYLNEKYKDIVFYGNSEKPIIVSVPHQLDDDLKGYFEVRASQWCKTQYPNTVWPYWEFTRSWEKYTDMINVSVAQCEMAFSYVFEGPDPERTYLAWGRGYTSAGGKNGDVEAILRGDNFQEGWDAAIEKNPEYIFVTGWNEWVVQKIDIQKRAPQAHTKPFANYTDNFNVEFSRDIEMTKSATYVSDGQGGYTEEGYGDNYFLQLAENIRRYKGFAQAQDTYQTIAPQVIDIYGADSQWDLVQERYLAQSTKKISRNSAGFYTELQRYKQAAPDNFIKEVKVAYDANNIYFRIEADAAITPYESGATNWMNLLIGVENSKGGHWENFNYVINRMPQTDQTTSVEAFFGENEYVCKRVGTAGYSLKENVLQISVPRASLGLSSGSFRLTFKVTDSIEKSEDILDYYVSGESFPIGRMCYVFEPNGLLNDSEKNTTVDNQMLLFVFLLATTVVVLGTAVGVCVIVRRKNK